MVLVSITDNTFVVNKQPGFIKDIYKNHQGKKSKLCNTADILLQKIKNILVLICYTLC